MQTLNLNRRMGGREQKNRRFAYLLLAPTVLYLAFMMIYPLTWSVFASFTDKKPGVESSFIGLKNYAELFFGRTTGPVFWKTVINTLTYTLVAVLLKVVLGMIMALALNAKKLKYKALFRSLLFLPWALPTLVSVYTWKWIFSDVGGAFNQILLSAQIINTPIGWLAKPMFAMLSVLIVNIWRGTPFVGVSILSALQTLDNDMYEAAKIDGAGSVQQFLNLTLPSIKSVLLLATVMTTIWTLNDFEIIWLLTKGGPDNATQVFSTLSYTTGFLNRQLGLSVAISVVSLPFLLPLVGLASRQTTNAE